MRRQLQRGTGRATEIIRVRGGRRNWRCPCGCDTIGFCDSHREKLAGVKVELEVELARTGRYGRRSDIRSGLTLPTCTTAGCYNRRYPPASSCESCMEAAG